MEPQTLPSQTLLVGDERTVRGLGQALDRSGHAWTAPSDVSEAHSCLEQGRFALLLVTVDLVGEPAFGLLERAIEEFPETGTLVVTERDDPELAAWVADHDVGGYIVKPFTPTEIEIAVGNALRWQRVETDKRAHRQALEQIVRARTTALERSAQQLKLTREETVSRLSRAVEYRDEETGGHTERMSRYCAVLAQRAGHDAESIRIASPMHDVGKVAVPDHILLKPGRLDADERREMERHTTIGHQILSGSGSALLELAAKIALSHHEKFDGTGYPRRLAGNDIPLEGRVAAIADVFDALTSDRRYRPAFGLDAALEMMAQERGRHFDPELLDLFLEPIEEIVEIRVRFADHAVAAQRAAAAAG